MTKHLMPWKVITNRKLHTIIIELIVGNNEWIKWQNSCDAQQEIIVRSHQNVYGSRRRFNKIIEYENSGREEWSKDLEGPFTVRVYFFDVVVADKQSKFPKWFRNWILFHTLAALCCAQTMRFVEIVDNKCNIVVTTRGKYDWRCCM